MKYAYADLISFKKIEPSNVALIKSVGNKMSGEKMGKYVFRSLQKNKRFFYIFSTHYDNIEISSILIRLDCRIFLFYVQEPNSVLVY